MGTTPLRLDPDGAAASIAVRIKNIADAESYVREVYRRYEGLKSFENKLDELGLTEAISRILSDRE